MKKAGPIVLGLLALSVGCGREAAESYVELPGGLRGAVHPNENDRLSATTDAPVVRIELPSEDAALPSTLAPLARFDTAAVDVASELAFGTLIDAEVAADGSMMLLDGSSSVIRVLDPASRPVQTLGGSGEGPGGLSGARRLFWLGPDELGAFGRRRLDGFRRGADGFRPSGRTPIPAVDAQSACASAGRLYVLGIRSTADGPSVDPDSPQALDEGNLQPALIHEIGEDGEIRRSFSVPYAGVVPDPAQQRQLTSAIASGVLECGPGRVWAGYSILGEVHAFDEDSRLAWIVRLTDFRRPGYLFRWDEAGRAAGMDIEPGAFDSGYFDESLDRISLLSEHVLAIQVTRVERGTDQEGFPETLTYRTYLLDPENGHFLGGFTADHQILGGGNGMAILYRERPSPRVSVVRIEG